MWTKALIGIIALIVVSLVTFIIISNRRRIVGAVTGVATVAATAAGGSGLFSMVWKGPGLRKLFVVALAAAYFFLPALAGLILFLLFGLGAGGGTGWGLGAVFGVISFLGGLGLAAAFQWFFGRMVVTETDQARALVQFLGKIINDVDVTGEYTSLEPGVYFVLPFLDEQLVVKTDERTLDVEFPEPVLLADQQGHVALKLSMTWRVLDVGRWLISINTDEGKALMSAFIQKVEATTRSVGRSVLRQASLLQAFDDKDALVELIRQGVNAIIAPDNGAIIVRLQAPVYKPGDPKLDEAMNALQIATLNANAAKAEAKGTQATAAAKGLAEAQVRVAEAKLTAVLKKAGFTDPKDILRYIEMQEASEDGNLVVVRVDGADEAPVLKTIANALGLADRFGAIPGGGRKRGGSGSGTPPPTTGGGTGPAAPPAPPATPHHP